MVVLSEFCLVFICKRLISFVGCSFGRDEVICVMNKKESFSFVVRM